jgi:hypothetical protein
MRKYLTGIIYYGIYLVTLDKGEGIGYIYIVNKIYSGIDKFG